jgi:hypothetical protein
MPATNLILVELNEVNFEFVERYARRGSLPTLKKLVDNHGLIETSSEKRYEELEPWIQWVTAHTGLPLADHGIRRLGDIVQQDLDQTWEMLEAQGISVAAISPMNAKNRCRNARFFIPDPWTQTPVTGNAMLKALHRALSQVVSENASGRIAPASLFWLVANLIRYGRLDRVLGQVSRAMRSRSRPWSKALLLDRLLADVFVSCWKSTRPQFASLFLNAAAHIQHHYMYSSSVYEGPHRNPEWYAKADIDPLLEVYQVYDQIVADVIRMEPTARLLIATGLHQDPCPNPVFYYRLKDHAQFLKRLGIQFLKVVPLMSRDFTVECKDQQGCERAAAILRGTVAPDGTPLFSAEVRAGSVFAMLIYPLEIAAPFPIRDAEGLSWDLIGEVVFVALKNGVHNGTGYLIDTSLHGSESHAAIPLSSLHQRVLSAFATGARNAPLIV